MSLIKQLHPDIVILGLFAENDIRGDYYKGYLKVDVKCGYRLRKGRWLQTRSIDFLRTHSYLWMFIKHKQNLRRRDERQAQFEAALKQALQEVMQPTLSAIVKLRNYCEINSIVFGVVMIPPRRGKTVFDERLKVFVQEEMIDVLNLGSKGYGKQEYLSGDAHWNEKGHEKAARFVVPLVVRLLDIRQE